MITPTAQRTFSNVYWQRSVLIPDVITSFLSHLKKTEPALCCRQATSTAMSLLQCEYLPLTASASASAHILAQKGNLFFDEQVLSFRPNWNTNRMRLLPKTFQSLFSVEVEWLGTRTQALLNPEETAARRHLLLANHENRQHSYLVPSSDLLDVTV